MSHTGYLWTHIAISADESVVIACASSDKLYKSSDGGDSWTAVGGINIWRGIAVSADGSIILAVTAYSGMFVSGNGGVGFSSAGDPNVPYSGVRMTSSANHHFVISSNGQVYKNIGDATFVKASNDLPSIPWVSIDLEVNAAAVVIVVSSEPSKLWPRRTKATAGYIQIK